MSEGPTSFKLSPLLFGLLVLVVMVAHSEGVGTLTAPVKPAEFKDVNEMRAYVKALNDYYVLMGRPR